MSPEQCLERALNRYADRIYRLALLYDPHPTRAARATATAFQALDWKTVHLDDQLEGRLVAALPRPRRRSWHSALAPLPTDFWRLPATTRVALALKLARGYSTDEIAGILGQGPDGTRQALLDALTGGIQRNAPEACRHSLMLRLDAGGAERAHLLTCEACRATAARIAEAETTLAATLQQATGGCRLPRATLDAIQSAQNRSRNVAPLWQRPVTLSAMVAVVVLLFIAALIIPGSTTQSRAEPLATAPDFLAMAISRYGTPPEGEGIVHQRFHINVHQPSLTFEAETWTDATNPGRHRMQVTANNVVQEWQAGDGEGSLRYLSNGTLQSCGRNYPGASNATDTISRWSMDADDQAAMRTSRWQFGAWAIGRRYLERAQAAERLRSLGVVRENSNSVVTLAAEGSTISGTLLLKIDVADATLREIREVLVDNGTTHVMVPWRLVSTEHLEIASTTEAGTLSSFPLRPRPPENERPVPILDSACPLWGTDHAYSLAGTLRRGATPIVGLGQVPQEIDRIYLAGRKRGYGEAYGEADYLRLIYVGASKRLTLVAMPGLEGPVTTSTIPPGAISTGQWLVQIRSAGIAEVRGEARPAPDASRAAAPSIWFVAEGWTEAEVIRMLASAHLLNLDDVRAQRSLIYDPELTSVAAMTSTHSP